MNEFQELLNDFINNNPERTQQELSDALFEYVASEDFQYELINQINAPSRGEMALKNKRSQRLSYNRRETERDQLRFLNDFVNVKKTLEDQEVIEKVSQNTLPMLNGAGLYKTNFFSFIEDGYLLYTSTSSLNLRGIGSSTPGSMKFKIDKSLKELKAKTSNGELLSIFDIKDILVAKDYYSNDSRRIKEIIVLLKHDVNNRNVEYGRNIIQNLDDLLREVQSEPCGKSFQRTSRKLEIIDKHIRGIVLDELELASEKLTDEFFRNKISFDEYIEKKTRLYEDGNNFWP